MKLECNWCSAWVHAGCEQLPEEDFRPSEYVRTRDSSRLTTVLEHVKLDAVKYARILDVSVDIGRALREVNEVGQEQKEISSGESQSLRY